MHFLARFQALSRATHLAHLAALNTTSSLALRAQLEPISNGQWALLQGYVRSLEGTFGADAFAGLPPPVLAGVQAQVQVRLPSV